MLVFTLACMLVPKTKQTSTDSNNDNNTNNSDNNNNNTKLVLYRSPEFCLKLL